MRAVALTWFLGFFLAMVAMLTAWEISGIREIPLVAKTVLAAAASAAFQALIPLTKIGEHHLATLAAKPATGRLANVAEEMAIATGHLPGSVLVHDSDIPNVGAFPTESGVVVMATTGAVELLDRAELQALVAAQFAGLEDKWCRLATKAEYAWGFTIFGAVVGFVVSPFVAFLAIALIFLPRWVETTRDLCADVAAVQASRNPAALATALRDLRPAAAAAHKLQVGNFFVTASPFLVLPKRVQSRTTAGEGEKSRTYSSADEIAAELGLRADRAEKLAAGGDPSEFTGKEYRRRYFQLGTTETLTKEEKKRSDALVESERVEEFARRGKVAPTVEDPVALARKHLPADHRFWELHARMERKETGLRDVPAYLKMVGELHRLEQESVVQSVAMATNPASVAQGWYPDPQHPSQLRWWDGNAWTQHVHARQNA